jgi:hypothetical protein
MLKTIRDMAVGAIITFAAIFSAASLAVVGTPPDLGFALIDGEWLRGLANGQNSSYRSGITAAGTTQATGTTLPGAFAFISVDTAANLAGVNLPPCVPGTEIALYNSTANTLVIYPAIANNTLTGIQDTINATTSIQAATHTSRYFFCPKAGI